MYTWKIKKRIRSFSLFRLSHILLVLLSCTGCAVDKPTVTPDEGPINNISEKYASPEVFVFEDTNSNGQFDSGENPLHQVLITSHSNVHGGDERKSTWTDEDGRAIVSAHFTHYFDIYVIPLCGYKPSTPIRWFGGDTETIEVGLVPVQPREGRAVVRFFFWLDEDRDGEHDPHEVPLPNTSLQIVLSEGDLFAEDIINDDLAITTNDSGWGELDLGNSCGSFLTSFQFITPGRDNFWNITYIDPEPRMIDEEPPWPYYLNSEYDYDLGETIIKVGLAQNVEHDPPLPILRVARQQVIVFEDANANGVYDSGEKGLPDVPIISWAYFNDGLRQRRLDFTDFQGQANLGLFYDKTINVIAGAPCGYVPTTPDIVTIDQQSEDTIYFGFASALNREAGNATIRIHLWHDVNGDGIQSQDEPPWAGESLILYPFDNIGPENQQLYRFWIDDLTVITDQNGWGELDLGNTCGVVELDPTLVYRWRGESVTSHYDPEPVAYEPESFVNNHARIYFAYDNDLNVIDIALTDISN